MVEFHKKEDLENAAEATLTVKDGEKVEPKDRLVLAPAGTREAPVELEVMLLSEYVQQRKKEKGKKSGESSPDKGRKRDRDEAGDTDANDIEVETKEVEKFTIDWQPGCVIKMKGLPEECDREAMMDAIAAGLDISVDDIKARKIYADYSRGQTEGAIRFPEKSDEIGKLANRLKEGEVKIKDTQVQEVVVLEGDEEKKYWEDFIEFKNKQRLQREEEKQEKRAGRNKRQKRGGRSH
jgi:hypothetical protein